MNINKEQLKRDMELSFSWKMIQENFLKALPSFDDEVFRKDIHQLIDRHLEEMKKHQKDWLERTEYFDGMEHGMALRGDD